ncbi:MAG: aminotransferase class I/II-fold pyridoxal phosphate-dependent enzyme [Planctomycetota bacterium]
MSPNGAVDAARYFLDPARADRSHSAMVRGLVGSSILRIAAEVRALRAQGRQICNLTVGDFDPAQFLPPPALLEGVVRAMHEGHTNYPPPDGIPELRAAIRAHYEQELGLAYPTESILVAAGARPILFGTYGVVCDPGDTVVFPVPSWNNEHYVQAFGARAIALPVRAEDNFFPTAEQLRPHLGDARLLVINSPQNPSGTVVAADQLAAIARLVVDENRRRERNGDKALFLLYDQVYWTLTYGGARHVTPVGLVPECAPYTVLLDAISKSFAATGLRVGWAAGAPPLIARMRDYLGHVGAWAPKPEQMATARFLADPGRPAWQDGFRRELKERLDIAYAGVAAMHRDGFPVDAIAPQGAIYLSVRFDLIGKRFATNDEIRRHVLEAAAVAMVPFQAFGLEGDTGWFRWSVGAVAKAELEAMFPRLRAALA